MPFNLPPPWDPGFALPSNVRDEGLERRAFVTKQMPRGTYDDPRVGTGGYVVPQYVQDEGYGQGTYTTKWQPGGTYNGPRVPNWLNRRPDLVSDARLPGGGRQLDFVRKAVAGLAGLGGISGEIEMPPVPALFKRYGDQAATAMLRGVSQLPPGTRKAQLKRVMDVVDPTLWRRTAKHANQLAARGVPPAKALHMGLSHAMSTGIAAEMVKTGRTKRLPPARSLLGLGCYGCAAVLGGTPGTAYQSLGATAKFIAGASFTDAGHAPQIQVGPWVFDDVSGASQTIVPTFWDSQPALMKQTVDAITKMYMQGAIADGLFSGNPTMGGPISVTAMANFEIGALPKIFGGGRVSSTIGIPKSILNGTLPIYKTVHPTTGKKMGLYITKIGTTAFPSMTLQYKEIPSNVVGNLLDFIVELVSKVIDVVETVVTHLDTLACNLVSAPGIGAAATKAGGPAGAAGAGIAAAACGAPVPPPPPKQDSILPIAIIGGAALVAILVVGKGRSSP